jgi:hypothetical protein
MSRSKKIDSINCDGTFVEPVYPELPKGFVPGQRLSMSKMSATIECDDPEYRESFGKQANYEPDSGVENQRSAFNSDPPNLAENVVSQRENKPLLTGPAPQTQSSNARLAQSVMDKIVASGIKRTLTFKETEMPPEPTLKYPPPKQSGTDLAYDIPNRWTDAKIASDKSVFADPEVNPYKLYGATVDLWGDEWLDWEPETILETAEADGVMIDQVNLGKMFAIRSLLKTEEFFREPRVFEKICIAFADKMVDFGVLQMPKLYEVAGAVALVEKKFRTGQYSDEVAIFVAMLAVNEGFLLLPPELNFAGAPFNLELISRLGEETMTLQDKIISAMGSPEINQDEAIQYKRLMVCSYYIKNMIDGAK